MLGEIWGLIPLHAKIVIGLLLYAGLIWAVCKVLSGSTPKNSECTKF